MGEEMNSNPGAEIARYSRTARMLHWIVALLVFVTWPMGLMIDFVKDEVQLDFYLVHESVGFLVFWFILLRIGAKFYQTAPAIVGTTLERVAAHRSWADLHLPDHHAGLRFFSHQRTRFSSAMVRGNPDLEPAG